MATRTTLSTKPTRQLGELLQEQQEPFILEVYLSERGYVVRNNLTSGANFIGCHGNSCKFLNKSGSGSQNKSKKGIPHFPKVLKVVCNKLFTVKGLSARSSGDDEDGKLGVSEMDRNNQQTAEPDRFSSASSTTVYNSCSDSDLDEPSMFSDHPNSLKLHDQREKQAAADTKFQWSCMEDNKQQSPVSVLEEISTSGSSLDNTKGVSSTRQKSFMLPKLITEDSILSASLWSLLLQTTQGKSSSTGLTTQLQDPDWSTSSRFSITKRVLMQTKQLLFDCVRELVDSHDREAKGREFLGSEEIGKVICEKMKAWGKRCGDESNIAELLESDMIDSRREWSEFESQRRNIGVVIGNAILEEITTEVVVDMIIQCPA